MLALAMALSSALAWGTGDFVGGMAAKRFAMPLLLLGTSLGGTLFAALLVAVSGQPVPPGGDLALGALGGMAGLLALGAFYRALAIGTMSIVAPISASGTAIPVAVGIAGGDPTGPLTIAGFVLTIGGVMLASREQQETGTGARAGRPSREDHRRSVLLACVAAVGFGCLYVLIQRASHSSELWPVLSLKGTSLLVMALVVAGAARAGRLPATRFPAREWNAPLAVGVLDVTANSTYAYASTHGPLSATAVVASLFPVVTVLLAHRLLGERLARSQQVGVALALAGVALLAAA